MAFPENLKLLTLALLKQHFVVILVVAMPWILPID
jgi:hypothetical protein